MARKEVNRLGVLGATSYIIGSVIGSGIFVSPKGILIHAGSVGLSLIIWVASAVLACLTAINYIELGTSIPESGAEFAYINYVGWSPIAFSFLWLASMIQGSCSGATLALTFGEYIMEAITPITCLSSEDRRFAVLLLACGILMATSLLNMFSLGRFASRLQFVSMTAKVSALTMIIGIGFYFMIFKGETQHFSKEYIFNGSDWSASQIVLALYQGNWAYGGYTILNYGMEDVQIKDFKRTVPLAVLCGLSVSAFVYVLANVAYFVVLTPQQILNSSAVATTFAQNTIGPGSYAMPALIGFLMLGSVNAEIFAWSRYILAGSRRGMMPTIWSLIHPENDSPRAAVFTHAFLCMMFCLIGDVYTLVSYLTITALMSTMFSVAALIYIKWRSVPVSTNAVKFHIFWPILNLFVNIALLIIPVLAEPIKSGIGFGLFVLGIGCYFIFYRPNKKLQFLSAVDAAITYCGQQVFWTVVDKAPLYKKEVEVSAEQNSEGRTKRSISTVSEIVSNDDSNGQRIEYEASQQLSTTKL